ncbi:glycosyltransferase family 2 protein [Leptothrix ochracea]|uniref:glycosyltransferase family 2 protein n=1 Tax=Leptothrix ochracea TaxID=735331 RepID=UPI0034E26FAE
MKLSATIITLNEERNIERCLRSLQGVADEIVVVDSGSTDTTLALCARYGARVIAQPWLGYSAQKNLANAQAEHDWILSLDADEALDEPLRQAVLAWKVRPTPTPARINRMTNYCGHFVRHGGWYPDHKVRLFDRRQARWEGLIHEDLIGVDRRSAELLPGHCLHYSYYTLDEHRAQTQRFTTLSAQELHARGKKASLTKRFLSPAARFLSDYLFRLGFLDGPAGWHIARISAHATYLKYDKLHKLTQQR